VASEISSALCILVPIIFIVGFAVIEVLMGRKNRQHERLLAAGWEYDEARNAYQLNGGGWMTLAAATAVQQQRWKSNA
jgi:hypothetical protein